MLFPDQFTVILDANVLYPFMTRDILLHFAQVGLYRARWTEDIIAETQRALNKNKPHLAEKHQKMLCRVRENFNNCFVSGYENLIEGLNLQDPKDRHVLAAAIRCGAQHIVTENRKHFPEEILDQFDIQPISADEFLANTYELYPGHGTEIIRNIQRRYRKPAFTPAEFMKSLMINGLPRLSMALQQHCGPTWDPAGEFSPDGQLH